MKTMHLFAGAGGGLLSDLILGHEPIVAVEWDRYACQVLRERAAEGWFPSLQVYEGDVRMFDPSEYAGRVDCIHAGFPCQDISVAGKQAGLGEGTRSGLYREVLRIAGVVRPKYLFLENVSAILSNGLGTVLGDLAEMGYDCRWCCIKASDVGAPHGRDRWWCLATMGNSKHNGQSTSEINRSIGTGGDDYQTWQEQAKQPQRSSEQYGELADSNGIGQSRQREYVGCINSAQNKNRETNRIINSSERIKGWWDVEPIVGRVADGVANRVDKLKAIGNGQVPLQAAVAWKLLGGE